MATHKIVKRDGHAYIELPPQFLNEEEVELFMLRDGYYLLTYALATLGTTKQQEIPAERPAGRAKGITDAEKAVLKKMLAVKFELRTPPNIQKQLTPEERQTLENLVQKNMINVFKSKKYPEGVYNVRDSVYGMLKETPGQPRETPDYFITSDQKEAYFFSQNAKKAGHDKEIIAVKGFDGRFYAVTKKYLQRVQPVIKDALTSETELSKVAKKAGLEPEAVRAVLTILSERGEVIEKRRDTFALA